MKRLKTAFATLALFFSINNSFAEDNWTFEVEPYFFGANIKGDTTVRQINDAPVDLDFERIWDTLQSGGMLHFETYYKNKWGLILDYGFMDLNDGLEGDSNRTLDANLRQGVLEAFLVRRFPKDKLTLDLYSGIRWWDNDIGITVASGVGTNFQEIEASWVDLVIGGRVTHKVNEKFSIFGQADVGGFGLEADITYSAIAGLKYYFTDSVALSFKYKATWVDYSNDASNPSDRFEYDTVTHGPAIGVTFTF